MNQQEFLSQVVGRLQEAGLQYMLTGSVASGRYGEVRSTLDIDIVVDAQWPGVQEFARSFGDDYYVSEDAARQAWQRRSMFNIIHGPSGQKADIIFRKARDFGRLAFSRRRRETVFGVAVDIISPEDIILAKLEWSTKGESERQYRDAVRVAEVQGPALDLAYMRKWADELGVVDLLERLLNEAT